MIRLFIVYDTVGYFHRAIFHHMLPEDDYKDAKKLPLQLYNNVVPEAHFSEAFCALHICQIHKVNAPLDNTHFEKQFFRSAYVH